MGCRRSSDFYDSEIARRIFDWKANHREFVGVGAVAGNSKGVKGISCVPLLAQPVEYMMRGYEIPVGDDAPSSPCEPYFEVYERWLFLPPVLGLLNESQYRADRISDLGYVRSDAFHIR